MTDSGLLDRQPARGDTSPARWRFSGRLADVERDDLRALLDRATAGDATIRSRTADVIARVRREGDGALFAFARSFDGVELEQLEVPRRSCRRALEEVPPALRAAMERAADNLSRVHSAFMPRVSETSPEPGIVIGRRPDPLGRVGIYAPGGRATYPSSVLMGAIPARVAGVGEVILCSPPGRDGQLSAAVLAACALADVDRVFTVGGAGAIAAMAYGTESVPRVDRVVGPGNAYVAEAKLQLTGVVAIDAPAGPTELLVIADDSSDAGIVARELVAQAEHDPLACVVALVAGEAKAAEIGKAVERELRSAPRRAIVEEALAGQGGLLAVASLDEAIAFANRYAPEHVALAMPSAERCAALLPALRNAGTIFVGECASNAFGDYLTGANHVLPTGGLARSYSGLSPLDFVRWTTYQRIDRAAAARLASDVALFAEAESLPGHASAARAWESSGVSVAADASPTASLNPGAPRSLRTRSAIACLPLYADDENASQYAIDLGDNTNLWGMPPAAEQALRELPGAVLSRYPSPYSEPLKAALLAHVGCPNAGIVTGCGSDDVIDLAMRAFGAPGDSIAFPSPTFSMIPVFARINGLAPMAIPLRDADSGYDVDAERLAESGAAIIYLCSPNNPTGTTMSRAGLEYILERSRGIVVLDEAYAEFAAASHVDLIAGSDRLLVTRTLSKAFGLAGLRIGYGIGDPQLVSIVERARGPYKVTVAAERATLAALSARADGREWVRSHAALACKHRDRFAEGLRRIGLAPLPSDANFVLVPTKRASALAAHLRAAGIRVRVFTELPSQIAAFATAEGKALRISVGPWEMMERALTALAAADA